MVLVILIRSGSLDTPNKAGAAVAKLALISVSRWAAIMAGIASSITEFCLLATRSYPSQPVAAAITNKLMVKIIASSNLLPIPRLTAIGPQKVN